MQYTFYIDVYFMKNLILDLDIVVLTALIRKHRLPIRILLAVLIADACTVLAVLYMPYAVAVGLNYAVIYPGMIYAAFRAKHWMGFWKDLCTGYVVTWLMGGLLEWLMRQTAYQGFWYVSQAAACISVMVILRLRSRRSQYAQSGTAVLHIQKEKGFRIEVRAYYDSGNLLKDPYGGKPVYIVDAKALQTCESFLKSKIRLIPFSTVGNESGIMEVCTIDEIQLFFGGKTIVLSYPVIGICRVKLFEGKEYDMLLNAECFEEEENCT